jgi:O-acetyl-ADP-ribose deacetylase (regulator of RNase III)
MILKRFYTISLIKGDISQLKNVDAIVTSTNEYLQGNKNPSYWRFNGRLNVDGAVRNAININELDEELSGKRLTIGNAVMTKASGRIFANGIKFIIHTVTPGLTILSLSLHHYYHPSS